MNAKRLVIALALVVAVVATGGGAVATVAAQDAGTNDCTYSVEGDTVAAPITDSDVGTMCSGGGCTLYCGP